VQLAGADIDRINKPGAAGDEHVGKSAGGGADVETDPVRHSHAETVERAVELDAAPRHPRKRRQRLKLRIDRDGLRRLAHRYGVRRHQAGGDRRLRLGPAFEQAPLDKQDIGTLAKGHRVVPFSAHHPRA
jgi:hypothetical protein